MKACVVAGPRKHEIVELPVPQIDENEVLIKVSVCGVCASELHPWENGIGKEFHVFGHEPVGVIEKVGAHVTGFQAGDRVTGLIHRAFAEYAKADYRHIVKVPDELDDLEALGEPLSCLVSGANRTPVSIGDKVAIIGTGFMGLGFMQLMKMKGAGTMIAVGLRQDALQHALRFGADAAVLPHEVDEKYKVVDWDQMDRGVNVAVEASGTQGGLDLAGEMTAVHGTMAVVGYHQGNGGSRNVNMQLWNWKAIHVINAHERRNHVHMEAMKTGLELIRQGRFNMKEMITHVYRYDEVDKAFEAIKHKPQGFIKAVIQLS